MTFAFCTPITNTDSNTIDSHFCTIDSRFLKTDTGVLTQEVPN